MGNIEEHKKWAIGLTQQEFEREYVNRFPWGSDTIPDVNSWLGFRNPVPDTIENFNPELLIDADYELLPKKEKETEVEEKPRYYCRGCKKEFSYRVAQAGHEKTCKAFLNVRL